MRKLLSFGVVVATAAALVAPVVQASPAAAAGTNTTVVLTFDDGVATQSAARTALNAHGMDGTFYVNSSHLGPPNYLGAAELLAMQGEGHEIGGHTVAHPSLSTIPIDQVVSEVCQDRTNLVGLGLQVTSFAYPYGVGFNDNAVRQVVQGCGYNSARRANGLFSTAPECLNTGCGFPYADTNPPADPYGVRTGDNAAAETTLAELQAQVTRVEDHGGGVVPIVFHEICDAACDPYSTPVATFSAFLDWLQARAASGTEVKTMHQVVGGTVKPVDSTAPSSTIACDGSACTTDFYNASMLVSLTSSDGAGSGVGSIRYTLDGSAPTSTSASYTQPFSLAANTTVRYRAYDNFGNQEAVKTQNIKIDAAAPTSSIACNGSACSANGYTSAASVTLTANDGTGSGVSAIRYTLDGSAPSLASPAYSSPLGISSTKTVRFRAYDDVGNAEAVKTKVVLIDPDAPTTSATCNGAACSGGFYHGSVQVGLSASDASGSGVKEVRYTTDGSDPTGSSTIYTAAFSVASTKTVKFRAWDKAGNAEATKTQVVAIDNAAPTATVKCNNVACKTTWYRGSVKVTLSASDTGGSGVAAIRFTTDGSTPSASSPRYSGPITLSTTKTVKYRSFDGAGNASPVGSVQVKIDKTAPTLLFAALKNLARVTGSVPMAVKVSDAQSKVAKVMFYVDGRLRSTDAKATFSFVWDTAKATKRQHTLTAKAVDKAGNSRIRSIVVTVR